MAYFRKLGILGVTPELRENKFHVFLSKKLIIQPNEVALLTSSIALDVQAGFEICLCTKFDEEAEIQYTKKQEVIIPYHNATTQVVELERGDEIGYFCLYLAVSPKVRILHRFKKATNFIQLKLDGPGAVIPRKRENIVYLYSCMPYLLPASESVELESQVAFRMPKGYGVCVYSPYGRCQLIDDQPISITYTNETNHIAQFRRKQLIARVEFYQIITEPPQIIAVGRFEGDRKRKYIDEELPCCSKSLF